MNTPLRFDATSVEPDAALEPLPAGKYPFIIQKAEVKPTKRRDGELLELTLRVIDGQYKGRVVFDRLNIRNPNQTAVDIAMKRLSAYCHATQRLRIESANDLLNIPFVATVSISVDPTGQYQPRNEIRGVEKGGTGSAPTPAAPSSPAPASGASVPPWAS